MKQLNIAIIRYQVRINRAKSVLDDSPTHRYAKRLKEALFRWPHLVHWHLKEKLWTLIEVNFLIPHPYPYERDDQDNFKPEWIHPKIKSVLYKMQLKGLIHGEDRNAKVKEILSIPTEIPKTREEIYRNMDSNVTDSDTELDTEGDVSDSDNTAWESEVDVGAAPAVAADAKDAKERTP